jgi:hypothetical protein
MKYVRIALLSAAATYLLPFATPAYAELGHPSGCAQCGPVATAAPTGRVPVIGPELEIGIPPPATALGPETGLARPLANRCHEEVWDATYPREYHVVCP